MDTPTFPIPRGGPQLRICERCQTQKQMMPSQRVCGACMALKEEESSVTNQRLTAILDTLRGMKESLDTLNVRLAAFKDGPKKGGK